MWYDPIIAFVLRSPLHGLVGKGFLLINYTGNKSGKKYSVPVSYLEDGDDYLVTSLRKRKWWRNFRGGAQVTLHVNGRKVAAIAEAITDPEAVTKDLTTYLENLRFVARSLKIDIDENGRANMEQVMKEAETRVMVRIKPVMDKPGQDHTE